MSKAPTNQPSANPASSKVRDDVTEATLVTDAGGAGVSGGPALLAEEEEALLEQARAHWQLGDWAALAGLAERPLEHHPDRGKLALLAAVGFAQTGNFKGARLFARRACDWGCPRDLVSRVLIGGVHNSLGRVASVLGDDDRAVAQFEASVAIVSPRADNRALGRARQIHEKARLGQLPEAAALLGRDLAALQNEPMPAREKLTSLAKDMELLRAEVDTGLGLRPRKSVARAIGAPDLRPARSETSAPFVVAVAGIARSGSTWVYNATRLLCDAADLTYRATWVSDYRPKGHLDRDLHIVKLHDPGDLPAAAHCIITSHRDLAERLASLVRMGWLSKSPDDIRAMALKQTRIAQYWLDQTNCGILYDDIVTTPAAAVLRIAECLEIPCTQATAEQIARDLDALPNPKSPRGRYGHDPETLMHPEHRSADDRDKDHYLAIVRDALSSGDP